ncbi:MAG TPA: hypothetical protein VEK76_06805 [Candidatus Binatia bacterium]|nr:hypothetical protein [Candidatus Binatia bacterium]
MSMRLVDALLLCAATTCAAACGPARGDSGGLPGPATGTPTPAITAGSSAPTPAPSAGAVLGTASNSAGWTSEVTAQPDGRLELSVTVSGPLTLYGGCVPTLTARAQTPAGASVPIPPTTLPAGAHCLAIALISVPPGTTRTFTADLAEPTAPGVYVIQGTLDPSGGDRPQVPAVTISI